MRRFVPSPYRLVQITFAALLVGIIVACNPVQPRVDHRGYLPKDEDMQKVQIGMSKQEVQALLGSPSTEATIEDLGDSYYYISSTVQTTAFLPPEVVDRQIFAVRFDADSRVHSFAHYGLEDGKIIDFISRETPTRGKELSVLQQLFSNIGRFNPGGAPRAGPGPIGGGG